MTLSRLHAPVLVAWTGAEFLGAWFTPAMGLLPVFAFVISWAPYAAYCNWLAERV